jgi:hypothetical protein
MEMRREAAELEDADEVVQLAVKITANVDR